MTEMDAIRNAGVIGAGGAGFPTYAKLKARAEYVLLNGAECEPLLRVDQQIMEFRADDVVSGTAAALRVTGAKKAIIGIKGKHAAAIDALRRAINKDGLAEQVEVRVIRDVYPAGDEQILVYDLTGRVVPETGLPIQVGCVVLNSETAMNIHSALTGGCVTEKYLTVSGDVPKPVTLKVPVGIRIRDVLGAAGLTDTNGIFVIDGGPMMGNLLPDVDEFVTKKSKGYIVLKAEHPLVRKKLIDVPQAVRIGKSACEQCRMCTDLCPRYLLGHDMQPHKLMRALAYYTDDFTGQRTSYLCSQCGLCQFFSCPAGLYPRSASLYYRELLTREGMRYEPKDKVYGERAFRRHRLVSTKRLVRRLGLYEFDLPAPLQEGMLQADYVRIYMSQHVGAPARPTVSPGETVRVGQMVGSVGAESLGVPVHASISGIVEEANEQYVSISKNAIVDGGSYGECDWYAGGDERGARHLYGGSDG
ncbi:MAG: 4Fe-4S dicluster domain-containing protein [Clostridiales Family XIII bacterium]|jgi:Na+-translocating ferredoxin:NAD+ oxidoreductase RnfC subunit|nr:4Fe-4S dicluster domain-containing protein [Clostridiales Family XIII bacterium]